MILNKPYTNKQKADFIVEANNQLMIVEDKGDYLEAIMPTAKTNAELAKDLSMSKADFLTLAIALSNSIGQPITIEEIETLVYANEKTAFLFKYANEVKRSDPSMVEMSTGLGYSADLLDIMYINKDELLYKIENNIPL